MRYLNLFILSGLITFIMMGCNHGSSGGNPVNANSDLFALVISDIDNQYDETGADSSIASSIWGNVFATPIPSVTSYALNDSVYHSCSVEPGKVKLYDFRANLDLAPAVSNLRLNSSIGMLSATLPRPDTASSVTIHANDSIPIGSSVTVSWRSSNSDFYVCSLQYSYNDSAGTSVKWIDTIVTGNSVTFPGSLFQHNGYIDIRDLASINGPVPQAGATGNLTGSGVGFYYYENWSLKLFIHLRVGRGLTFATAFNPQKNARERFRDRLLQRFGLAETVTSESHLLSNGGLPSRSIRQMVVVTADIHQNQVGIYRFYCIGSVLSSPIPTMQYVKLNNNVYNQFSNNIIFGNEFQIYQQNLSTTIPSITMQVATSVGIVSGSVSMPDSIVSVSYSTDTLQIGTPFTLSWSRGHADFYNVYADYRRLDSTRSVLIWQLDTFVTGNSITISGTRFTHDGVLHIIEPIPMNGPFPQAGTIGNMTGTGAGFLYYYNGLHQQSNTIIVGNGYSTQTLMSHPPIDREHVLNSVKKALGVERAVAVSSE